MKGYHDTPDVSFDGISFRGKVILSGGIEHQRS